MGEVILELSISLDGHVTGPNVCDENPMGDGGEGIHDWIFATKSPAEAEAWEEEHFRTVGRP